MEKFPQGTPASNDNESSVVPFTGTHTERHESIETIDTAKITSMRSLLSEYTLTTSEMDAYRAQYGTPTIKEIIAHVNTSNEEDWQAKPKYFAFLLSSLSAPRTGEVTDE